MATPLAKLSVFQMVHPFAFRQILGERKLEELSAAEISAALEQFESCGLGMWAKNTTTPPQNADDLESRGESIRAKFGTRQPYKVPPLN